MMHKLMIAIVAAITVWAVSIPTDAEARGGFRSGGFRSGGFHGGFRGGFSGYRGGFNSGFRGFRGGFYRGPAIGFYPYFYVPVPYIYSGYSRGCYRSVRVKTRHGLRWRRVWVCR
jgi:hypothetical protein